jgi:excisionase family DNA binding protein
MMLTVKQVADELNIHTATVLRWVSTGKLQATVFQGIRNTYRFDPNYVRALKSGDNQLSANKSAEVNVEGIEEMYGKKAKNK